MLQNCGPGCSQWGTVLSGLRGSPHQQCHPFHTETDSRSILKMRKLSPKLRGIRGRRLRSTESSWLLPQAPHLPWASPSATWCSPVTRVQARQAAAVHTPSYASHGFHFPAAACPQLCLTDFTSLLQHAPSFALWTPTSPENKVITKSERLGGLLSFRDSKVTAILGRTTAQRRAPSLPVLQREPKKLSGLLLRVLPVF